MFAALGTVKPSIVDRSMVVLLEREEPWYERRLRLAEDRVRVRLGELAARLGDASWLDGAFSAGDLLMVHALMRLEGSGLLEEHPALAAYVARGQARPAYARAFAAQRAVFAGASGEASRP
jgi:glutathione S-transferase